MIYLVHYALNYKLLNAVHKFILMLDPPDHAVTTSTLCGGNICFPRHFDKIGNETLKSRENRNAYATSDALVSVTRIPLY